MSFFIPPDEVRFSFVRGSGPGGQNVNKVATRVQLRWNMFDSRVFTLEQKARLQQKLPALTKNGDVIVMVDTFRRQEENKKLATQKLLKLVAKALCVPKPRKLTKPSFASKQKILASKKRHSRIKEARKQKEKEGEEY